MGALVSLPWLATVALREGDVWRLVTGCIFGASALLVFSTSALYHAVPSPRAKPLLRTLDHCAIYLLIAGTYTPFTLGVLRGGWGWTLFGLTWAMAIIGITAKLSFGMRFPRLSTAVYVAMGWIGVVAVVPLLRSLPHAVLGWLLAGGLAYTAGVPFYVWKSRPYTHFMWHLFVLGGAACHFVAVLTVMRLAD